MKADVSWAGSAKSYVQVYKTIATLHWWVYEAGLTLSTMLQKVVTTFPVDLCELLKTFQM
jgi:hypothetical protein